MASGSSKSIVSMTLPQLKEKLRAKDLSVNGKKLELVERLQLVGLTIAELKEKLKKKKLPLQGCKAELVMRVQKGETNQSKVPKKTYPFRRKIPMKCSKCKTSVPNKEKLNHLDKCWFNNDGVPNVFLIHAYGRDYNGVFELLLAYPLDADFNELDELLQDVWMACCGHMSSFEIYKTLTLQTEPFWPTPVICLKKPFFADFDDDDKDKAMAGTRMEDYCGDEYSIIYQYDFGTTSEVVIKFLGKKHYPLPVGSLCRFNNILLRNELPNVTCKRCGKKAKLVMADGSCDLYCTNRCVVAAGEEEHMASPFLNSPRSGFCGYGRIW